MHKKRRLELIIERMAWKRAGRILEEAGMTGYTALPAFAGFGGGSRWQRDTDISGSRDMVVMVAIGDEATVTKALEDLQRLLESHIGVLNVSDVDVMRPELF
jgi:PII-like signaling protein